MAIFLAKEIFGIFNAEEKYFVIGKDKTNNVILSNAADLQYFIDTYSIEIGQFPGKPWINLYKNIRVTNPRWEYIIPKEIFNKLILEYIQTLVNEIKEKTNDKLLYFKNFIPYEKKLLQSFNTVCLKDGNELPPYSYKRTATGRLISDNNISLFTMSYERRQQILDTRFVDGNICSIDFTALEPRTILSFHNPEYLKDCSDVYKKIADECGLELTRNDVKLTLLKILNGAANFSIMRDTGLTEYQIEKLKSYVQDVFCYHDIIQKLKTEHETFGRCFNMFGRPIIVDNLSESSLFTYYMQSSSADICVIGFTKIINSIEKAKKINKLVPTAMIYDSIILDVNKQEKELACFIVKQGLNIRVNGETINFPLTIQFWENGEE